MRSVNYLFVHSHVIIYTIVTRIIGPLVFWAHVTVAHVKMPTRAPFLTIAISNVNVDLDIMVTHVQKLVNTLQNRAVIRFQ